MMRKNTTFRLPFLGWTMARLLSLSIRIGLRMRSCRNTSCQESGRHSNDLLTCGGSNVTDPIGSFFPGRAIDAIIPCSCEGTLIFAIKCVEIKWKRLRAKVTRKRKRKLILPPCRTGRAHHRKQQRKPLLLLQLQRLLLLHLPRRRNKGHKMLAKVKFPIIHWTSNRLFHIPCDLDQIFLGDILLVRFNVVGFHVATFWNGTSRVSTLFLVHYWNLWWKQSFGKMLFPQSME